MRPARQTLAGGYWPAWPVTRRSDRSRELGEPELRRLLSDLAATATPAACPHGSPVVLHFSGDFLCRQFRW